MVSASLSVRPDDPRRLSAVRRVLVLLLAANLVVVAVKLAIGLLSGSLALVGDALHSTIDALNNVLALLVVGLAAKAPDEDHPYGHGKFETLGALAIVGFMSITCFELIRDSIQRLLDMRGAPLLSDGQLAMLAATLAVNVVVAGYENRRGTMLQSELLLADAAHTRADVFITIGVLVSMLLARLGYWWADPVLALIIAGFIVRIAYRILQRAIPVLVDERAIPDTTIRILVESVEGVMSAYGIRSRGGSGTQPRYAEVTIAVDRNANVADAHAIADLVEDQLKRELRLSEVTVHVEPC